MRLTKKGKAYLTSIFVIIFILFALSSMSVFANKNTVEEYNYYIVQQNDTLWNIVVKYSDKNKDIRKTIYELQKLNNLKSSELTVGTRIIIGIKGKQ